MFVRSCFIDGGEPSQLSGITGPPRQPSSVTSVQRSDGVHRLRIHERSTPGMRKTSSLTFCIASRKSRSKMSPAGFSSTMRTELLMPRSESWWSK